MNYCCATATVNKLTTKILCNLLKNNMSNKILTFCSVVTCFATLSLLNISSAVAAPIANVVSGKGNAAVSSSARGVTRDFIVGSEATAFSPTSSGTNANATLTINPTTISTSADSGAAAGAKLNGFGNTTSSITGVGTQTAATITAGNTSNAKVTGAAGTGVTTANSNAGLQGGGFAGGTYTFSGMKP
jgi:hypothetical protein